MTGRATISFLHVGSAVLRGPELLHNARFDDWFEIAFYVWIVQSGRQLTVIDTGPPPDVSSLDARAKALRGEGAYWRSTNDADLATALRRRGLAPERVNDVILTSFRPYAISNIALFRNANIHVSATGFEELCHPRYPELAPALDDSTRCALTSLSATRLRCVEGTQETADGICVKEIGGHHQESLAVTIDVSDGDTSGFVIPDTIFRRENLQPDGLLGLAESVYEFIDARDWLQQQRRVILPIHDPAHLNSYPDGVVYS